MFNSIYEFYTKEWIKLNSEGLDGFTILRSSVAIKLLNHAYKLIVEGNEIIEIEKLPVEKKSFYWNVSKRYYDEQNKCIEASKAAYVLGLVNQNRNFKFNSSCKRKHLQKSKTKT